MPAGILAVVPVGFKLGIDGTDTARLLQSALEQRLDLGRLSSLSGCAMLPSSWAAMPSGT